MDNHSYRLVFVHAVPSGYHFRTPFRTRKSFVVLVRCHFSSLCADFYTPPVVSHAMLAIQQLASVKAVPFGGYSQAERQRIIMGQPELVEVIELDPSQVSSEHATISMHSCFPCWLAGEYHHAKFL